MSKMLKPILGVVAVAALVGAGIAPLVRAWGDNGGGRPGYTKQQINDGVLGNKIVFNSISDGQSGDEKDFVGARVDDGNHGVNNVWTGSDINVQPGKTYIINLYVHNNSPKGYDAVAENVMTQFSIAKNTGKTVQVNGFISSSNATPSEYWDYINFHSDKNFRLEYVPGSALLENNGVGAGGHGVKLSDDIVTTTKGVMIGYDKLDGKIPGCYQYSSYVTIKVKPVFETETNDFVVQKQVRRLGDKKWAKSISGLKAGDKVEYRIEYRNTSSQAVKNVMIKDVLPNNMNYIAGSTTLYNASTNGQWKAVKDGVTAKGINIGDYKPNGNAYLRFTAQVVDKSLVCGTTKVVNWGQAGVGDKTKQDSAEVYVDKKCQPNTPPNQPTPQTPSEIPSTGPATAVSSVIGAGSLVTALGYYLASRKKLQ